MSTSSYEKAGHRIITIVTRSFIEFILDVLLFLEFKYLDMFLLNGTKNKNNKFKKKA